MAQAVFDTQWQAHQPYPRSKRDPLTPDDSSGGTSNNLQYSYRNSSNQPRLNTASTQPGLGQGSQQPVKEEAHIYHFQSNQSKSMPSASSATQNPWDAYLAWDDGGESWAPVPDVNVEEYMGTLSATQGPTFNWDWNNPTFPTSSSHGGFADTGVIQQPLGNYSAHHYPYEDPQSAGVGVQLETTSSWSSVQRSSPESVPSLDSSYPSHRTSMDRSPPQQMDQARRSEQSNKDTPTSSSDGDANTSSSNHYHHQQQEVNQNKKRAAPSAEFVNDGPEGPKVTKRSKKVAHNTVEKRYRMNLNSKIAELRESVPSLRSTTKTSLSDEEDGDNGASGKGLRKAQVLSKANEYIHELERQARQLRNENETLKKKMAFLRTVAASEEPDGSPESYASPLPAVSAAQPIQRRTAKGFRPLAIQPAKGQSTTQRPGKNNNMNKALMGCLAGLTVFEGMQDHHQASNPNSRGLFAIPFELVRYMSSSRPFFHAPGFGSVDITLLTLLKVFLVGTALMSLLSPTLFERSQRGKKEKRQTAMRLYPAPPLASALEVRQKAWLTSIQTVWVPRRNVVLELAALGLKMFKIFVRSCIGWKGYAALTGFTEADEIARIKAWDIALDSQLTGGDPEICLDRLALTFLASLTLPTAPGRSALKAMHIYVLCKGLESRNLVRWLGIQSLTSNLATSFWNKARDLNYAAHPDALPTEPMAESQVLPEYVKILLEEESEDIFTSDVKQRAHNLSYNKPTYENVPFRDEGSECVVADFAIRSPLDALAAWWSSKVLRRALIAMIDETHDEKDIWNDLSLAYHSSPPSSGAQLRALIALAAFRPKGRQENIAFAIKMMDLHPPASSKSNIVLPSSSNIAGASSTDIRIALRSAMIAAALALPKSSASLSPPRFLKDIASILSDPDQDVTLLGFIAAYTTLQTLSKHVKLFEAMQEDIEKLAASLRILVGGEVGRSWDLGGETVRKCVTVCLEVCKRAAGIEKIEGGFSDQGYGSSVEPEVETEVEIGDFDEDTEVVIGDSSESSSGDSS